MQTNKILGEATDDLRKNVDAMAEKIPYFRAFQFARLYIVPLLFPVALFCAGAFVALRYTGALDIYILTSRIETIGGEIEENNRACISAVESNKKLKTEYETKLESLGNVLAARMGKKEKVITASGSIVPASIPSSIPAE